jgi:hypothetical protein
MKIVTHTLRAAVGCLLIPLLHLPRLLFLGLQISYSYVFNRHETLTADPTEHLKRARKLLHGQPADILYAALEVRFALERMTQREFLFTDKVSNRFRDDHDPVEKIKALRRADPQSVYPHRIFFVDKALGTRLEWGQYKPLDQQKAEYYRGRLGNLLHPKDGLRLGIWNDPWYADTKAFLTEAIDYLSVIADHNTPFFALQGLDHIEMICDPSDAGSTVEPIPGPDPALRASSSHGTSR